MLLVPVDLVAQPVGHAEALLVLLVPADLRVGVLRELLESDDEVLVVLWRVELGVLRLDTLPDALSRGALAAIVKSNKRFLDQFLIGLIWHLNLNF